MGLGSERVGFLPDALYEEVVKWLPIVSVEALIVIDDALLFLKRNNDPVKGKWWFPGGRIRRGEALKEALQREIKEETGLELSEHELINVYSRVFPERHDIAVAYLCMCKESKVTLNNEHSEYGLFRSIPVGLHPYLLETIQDSQWEKHL